MNRINLGQRMKVLAKVFCELYSIALMSNEKSYSTPKSFENADIFLALINIQYTLVFLYIPSHKSD